MQVEVLGERYQLQDPIGRGGMATIYRGHDMRMDRVVAIKVLREVYSTDPKFVTRFQREAKAASSLQHPNIVQVFDYGQSDGNYFIVMEMIDGTDLRRYLRSRGVLAIDRAMLITRDVALGLGAAHRRGIVHRDVKPQNILVGRDGSIKLTDFGIASVYKDINDERLTTTGMTLGTVQYYAPEQAQGEIVSPAADVYALGIVMYEMLTGRTPFDGDTPVAVAMQHIQDPPTPPSQLNPQIPPALEEIILRCLEKVPEMRFRDGSTLARALETLGEDDLEAPQAGLTPPISSPHAIPQRPNRRGTSSPGFAPVSGAGVLNQGSYTGDPSVQTLADPQPSYSNRQLGEYSPPSQRTNVAAQDRRDSRFATIATILILVTTLLLLGFSLYLANDLGFLPFGRSATPSTTPQATGTSVQQVKVPNLVRLTLQAAKQQAETQGFKLRVTNNMTDGIVIKQSPSADNLAPSGSEILVELKPAIKIPADLAGKPLETVKKLLADAGLKNVVVKADPANPRDTHYGPNTVTKVDPASGSLVTDDQTITLYVTNYNTATPTAVPTAVPTATPVPTAQPTATPVPTATPTSTPTT
jgi:serine/threonine-protein kinase